MSNDDTQSLNSVWEDLVVSILSVNNYSIEKTYLSLEGLRKQGLVNPQGLMKLGPTEIADRLRRAGYDRGEFMNTLFADRLSALGKYLKAKGVDQFEEALLSKNKKMIESVLKPVKGVGPVVLKNLFQLCGC